MDGLDSPAAFLEFVKDECAIYGVTTIFSDTARVDSGDGILCSGFFSTSMTDPADPRLAVALASPAETWLPILVHEYCHMCQWLDNDPLWQDAEDEVFMGWLTGTKELDPVQLEREFRYTRDMELDCEKRAIRLIKEWQLPISVSHYYKTANAYLSFYAVARDVRSWYEHPIYAVPEILCLMPGDRLLTPRELDSPGQEFTDLVVTHCLKSPIGEPT